VTQDLNTLLTALYVKIDDELGGPLWMGRPPMLTDSELVCVAALRRCPASPPRLTGCVMPASTSRASFRTCRSSRGTTSGCGPALGLVKRIIRMLARSRRFWLDDCWIVDSTPVPCGMSRPPVKCSDLAGWVGYGYCASHSRFYRGLKLYLVCTPAGMPILWALADPKIGEREVLAAMLEVDAGVAARHNGILLVRDKGFAGQNFETLLGEYGITMRPCRKNENACYGEPMLKKVRQPIESVNDPLKGQLDLENHGGRSSEGVGIRVAQRVLAMAAVIWHNNATNAPITRSLIAYDH